MVTGAGRSRCRRILQALTPGSAILEGAVRSHLRMFVSGSRVSEDSDQLAERARMVTGDLPG